MFLYKTKEVFDIFSMKDGSEHKSNLFLIEDSPKVFYSDEVPKIVRNSMRFGVYFLQVIDANTLMSCYLPCTKECLTEETLKKFGEVIARF